MSFDDCYQLGNVVKTHGLRGELLFFLDADDPSIYKELESVFIDIDGKLVPFFIQSIQLQGDRALVVLEDIDDVNAAADLVGKDLYLPLQQLPELPRGQYYYHDLIGFEVFDGQAKIGTVTEVYQIPNNHLMGVEYKGREILVPMKDEIVKSVNLIDKCVNTRLPDGLLDVYLSE